MDWLVCIGKECLLSLGMTSPGMKVGSVSPGLVRPQLSKHQNEKTCLIQGQGRHLILALYKVESCKEQKKSTLWGFRGRDYLKNTCSDKGIMGKMAFNGAGPGKGVPASTTCWQVACLGQIT